MRSEVTSQDTQQRSRAKGLIDQVLLSRAKSLVHFHTQDLNSPPDTATANVRWTS